MPGKRIFLKKLAPEHLTANGPIKVILEETHENDCKGGDFIMEDVRIILSGLWVALMLTNLLGDVLRIFAGDTIAGEIDGVKASQTVWLGIASCHSLGNYHRSHIAFWF